jgi:hypothetical protein
MEGSRCTLEVEPSQKTTSGNDHELVHPAMAFLLFALMACFSAGPSCSAETVTAYPAPKGEPLSLDYTVEANGQAVPVYLCKVAPSDPQRRWKAMDDKTNSANYFDTAAFGYFDAGSDTEIDITAREPLRTAKVLPSALHIQPAIDAGKVRFRISGPYTAAHARTQRNLAGCTAPLYKPNRTNAASEG